MGRGPGRKEEDHAVEGARLVFRSLVLDGVRWVYHGGVAAGSVGLFALGGFVPVMRGWLRDDVRDWGGVVQALGGVRLAGHADGRQGDLGLPLTRADAPTLHAVVAQVARKLGSRPPDQVRLAYVPCCGVVTRKGTRTLLLGMPLLHVLTVTELRAVLAHELAHLDQGDAARTTRATRFADALGRGLDDGRAWGPLAAWARLCHHTTSVMLGPIAKGQEARADRLAANLAGGPTAASALVKVALVQPLFEEVISHYDSEATHLNVYAFFRLFWDRLPEGFLTEMRRRVFGQPHRVDDSAHPPLLERLKRVQDLPDRLPSGLEVPILDAEQVPASATLGDPEAIEQALHDRLFRSRAVERSVFHRTGT